MNESMNECGVIPELLESYAFSDIMQQAGAIKSHCEYQVAASIAAPTPTQGSPVIAVQQGADRASLLTSVSATRTAWENHLGPGTASCRDTIRRSILKGHLRQQLPELASARLISRASRARECNVFRIYRRKFPAHRR